MAAMYDNDEGVIVEGDPLVVLTESVFVPAEAGVYVNVFAADSVLHDREVGVNVPPAPLSDGVIVAAAT